MFPCLHGVTQGDSIRDQIPVAFLKQGRGGLPRALAGHSYQLCVDTTYSSFEAECHSIMKRISDLNPIESYKYIKWYQMGKYRNLKKCIVEFNEN